jgi:hypothetical protein
MGNICGDRVGGERKQCPVNFTSFLSVKSNLFKSGDSDRWSRARDDLARGVLGDQDSEMLGGDERLRRPPT